MLWPFAFNSKYICLLSLLLHIEEKRGVYTNASTNAKGIRSGPILSDEKLVIHDIKKHLYAISLLNHEHENQKISDYIESLTHSSQLKVSMRVCENDF